MNTATKQSGVVQFFNNEFGFIRVDNNDGGKDVFLSSRELAKWKINSVAAGQRLIFDVAPGWKGPRAINVRLAA